MRTTCTVTAPPASTTAYRACANSTTGPAGCISMAGSSSGATMAVFKRRLRVLRKLLGLGTSPPVNSRVAFVR